MKSLHCTLLLVAMAFASLAISSHAADAAWPSFSPDGGDARRIAADPSNPKHLYLGTVNSWLYQSNDGGVSWSRVSKLSKVDNLVIDSIVVDAADPKTVLVGAWVFDRAAGSLFISHDAGLTWTAPKDMDGQSIRALVEARSDPRVYVAGTLTGVYRSEDHGEHWALISPEGSKELHEVESIAINPADPKAIFAGTWHLPWKTIDGGATWRTIKQGVIDDSDVFSIIVDPKAPATMYASACSGIYKSLDAGENFVKVQGIPATARRTRVLMQDPVNLDVVYAGTTEGLYQTTNAGAQWSRITGPDVIVNDVYVDPTDRTHVLMATDRSGVLMSNDAGVTFHDVNAGFSQRQVDALLTDPRNPHVLYVGILNDKNYGGVFVSEDDGAHWKQQSEGLGGVDVFSLAEASDGTLFAGTNHGIFRRNGTTWERKGLITALSNSDPKPVVPVPSKKRRRGARGGTGAERRATEGPKITASKTAQSKAARTASKREAQAAPLQIDSRVSALDLRGSTWFAATSTGIYRSTDQGATWQSGEAKPIETATASTAAASPAPVTPTAVPPTRASRASNSRKKAASRASASDAATPSATPVLPPTDYRFVDGSGPVIYAASRQTVSRSEDQGKTWQSVPRGELSSIEAMAATPEGELWIGGREGAYYSDDKGDTWHALNVPTVGINGLVYDADQKRVVLTSRQSTMIYAIDPGTKTWKWWDAGRNIHAVRWANGRLVGLSKYDGIVMQPVASVDAQTPGGH